MRVLLPLFLLACAGSTEPPNYEPPSELPAAFTACEAASDCEIVQLTCCDHCNGGTALSLRSDHRDEALATYGQDCGEGVACTEMACAPLEPTCDDGVCGAVEGAF